jgi:predicted MPP superfamily phosphohydrolase
MPWAIRTLLTISAIALPLYAYIALRSASSAGTIFPDAKRRARWIALVLLAWLYCFPVLILVLHLLGSSTRLPGPDDAPGLVDYLFLYPQWISLVIILELTAPFLVLDIVGLASRLFPARRQQWRPLLAYGRLALATAAVLYVPVRVFVDTTRVQDSSAEVRIKGLPAELQGFRITLLGDIQVDKYTGDSKIAQVHSIVRGRDPQLLFSSGDVVTGGTAYLNQAEEAMCGIKGSLASVAVMGDHDQWSAPDAIRAMHTRCGWMFMENEHRVFSWKGKRILVTGLTHIYSQRLNETRLKGILDSAPAADIRILLVHQPAEWLIRRVADYGYTIVAAGHTHGGQIVLHPLGFPLTPSMHETQYYSGCYTVGSTAVVVTDGVGLTLAPIRYHARSEVTTIVLQPEIAGATRE